MAASTVTLEPPVGDAVYRAWRESRVDADLAHAAAEQVRNQAGRNVIVVIESRFDEIMAKIGAQSAHMNEQSARLEEKIDAQNTRIEVLQRVIWPLIGIPATAVLGLLYEAVDG